MKMNEISVKKDKLLGIIKDNKDVHIEDYNEAMKGYRVGVVAGLEQLSKTVQGFAKEVEDALEEARNGGKMKINFSVDIWGPFRDLSKPESHEKDYEIVIGMIELDTSDQVELGRHEYRNYVQDEWDWSETFGSQITGSLSNYTQFSGSANTILSYGEQDETKQ